ncbi:hypothetical protein [Haloterrigena alkaliphila]|uniref:hypothetical protein n=1 Tax=Haloterrigena alkaliphila TaxID=2816475 RepID=UPI001CFFE1D3|nr:hypothetical protein [Haloterrigena alkaliphila]UHQ95099.1 hypothetical protein J0X25_19790 [Haloterrigena alkaliphila]
MTTRECFLTPTPQKSHHSLHYRTYFADAGGIQNHHDPMMTHLVSILLAQECRIADLEERLGSDGQ